MPPTPLTQTRQRQSIPPQRVSMSSAPSTPSSAGSLYSDDDDLSTAPTSSPNTPRHSKHIGSTGHADPTYLAARVKTLELELDRSNREMEDQVQRVAQLQVKIDELTEENNRGIIEAKTPLERRVKELEMIQEDMKSKVGIFLKTKREGSGIMSGSGEETNGLEDTEENFDKVALWQDVQRLKREIEIERKETERMKEERDKAEQTLGQQRDQREATVSAVQHYIQEARKELTNPTDSLTKSLDTAGTLLTRLREPNSVTGRPNKIADLHERILTLEREKETARKEILRLNSDHDRSSKTLKIELDTAKEEITTYTKKLSAMLEELETARSEAAHKESEARLAQNKIATLEAALNDASRIRERAIARVRADHTETNEKYEQQMELILREHQAALEAAQEELARRDGGKNDNVELENLKEENIELEKALDELQAEMTTILTEVDTWRARCEEAELKLQQMNESEDSDIAEGAQKAVGTKSSLSIADEDRDLVRRKYEKLKAEYKMVVTRLREERADREALQKIVEQNGMSPDAEAEMEKIIEESKEKVHKAEKERAEWELRAEVFKAQAKKATRDMELAVGELRQRLDATENTITSLKSQQENSNTTHKKVDPELITALKSSIATHEATTVSLRSQMVQIQRDYEKEMATLRSSHESALSRLQTDHDSEISSLRAQLESRLNSSTQKERDISALKSARELNSLDARVKELEIELESSHDRYEEKIKFLEGQLRSEHSSRIALQQDLEDERRAIEDQSSEAREQIKKLERRLHVMEDEVTKLMTKNMELVIQLSERDQ